MDAHAPKKAAWKSAGLFLLLASSASFARSWLARFFHNSLTDRVCFFSGALSHGVVGLEVAPVDEEAVGALTVIEGGIGAAYLRFITASISECNFSSRSVAETVGDGTWASMASMIACFMSVTI